MNYISYKDVRVIHEFNNTYLRNIRKLNLIINSCEKNIKILELKLLNFCKHNIIINHMSEDTEYFCDICNSNIINKEIYEYTEDMIDKNYLSLDMINKFNNDIYINTKHIIKNKYRIETYNNIIQNNKDKLLAFCKHNKVINNNILYHCNICFSNLDS
jgi:hypothetical protein